MTGRPFLVIGTSTDTAITVSREAASSQRPQGLVIDADHELSVGDVGATRIVLWADTAPAIATVVTSGAGEVRIWNVWKDGDLVQAWQNGASMIVDDTGHDLGLECHDGHEGDGPDLEVRLSFDRAWTQPDS